MATSLLKSFIEVVNHAVAKAGKKVQDSQGHKAERRTWSQAGQAVLQAEPSSKSVLEVWSSQTDQPGNDVGPGTVRVQAAESENVLEVSGEEIPSLELADQIAVCSESPLWNLIPCQWTPVPQLCRCPHNNNSVRQKTVV